MKKAFLYCGLSILIGLTACKDNEYTYEFNYSVPTVNILTNNSDGSAVASRCVYSYEAKESNGTTIGSVTSSAIVIDGSSYTLQTSSGPFKNNTYTVAFDNLSGMMTGNRNIPVTDGKFVFTTVFNNPSFFGITTNYNFPQQFAMCQYNIGDEYSVKTFPENSFFTGSTTTEYPGQNGTESNSTNSIYYMLSLNITDNTATMYMFNAKFSGSPMEPAKAQINIEGLSVEYNNGSIIAKGENIIPVIVEGNVETPYENYIFNNIEFKTTTTDLSECEINYTVAGRFRGNFLGSYIYNNKYITDQN